ncbi:MAG: MBL fold metallo-hydrolase [Euryarchaeota archaeon]|nr:MBL fold metallo-hydrolase [Euryarchaeota archaeon]MDE2044298.1 MBL fold metallo-hydrolase [Thermoplasmata archaeon]
MTVQELGNGRLLVDLGFQDLEGVIGSYLLPEEEGWALVEVGPTTCEARLLQGLREAGVEPRDVRDVLVTHIHLDHAGGAGLLADHLPRATFHIHEVGVPHMIDPRRLQESARRAWGPASDQLWGEIRPLPATRIHALKGGERIMLAHGKALHVLPAPGHARHHLAFFDALTQTVFTGDGAGVLVPGARHIRPAMPPPDLDIEQLLHSLQAMADTSPQKLAFSHYGVFDHAQDRLKEAGQAVERWRDVALAAARKEPTVAHVTHALEDEEQRRSREEGEPSDLASRSQAISGLEMAAMGLLRYFERSGLLPPKPPHGNA